MKVGGTMNRCRKNGARMKRCKMTLKQDNDFLINIDNLDDFLLTEILIRLPSETLLGFKLISKRWYSLISHPSFLNNHTRLQIERHVSTCFFSQHENLDLINRKPFYGTIGRLSFDHSSLNFSENTVLVVGQSEKMEVTILNSCHGLLLTLLEKKGCVRKLCIFNPLTNKKRIIPHTNENSRKSYGFAFGAKSSAVPPPGGNYYYYNHFNVVCILPRKTAFVFKIFSPETGTWRDSNETTIIKYREDLDQCSVPLRAVCLRGVVYWLIGSGYIIAFNVVKEESRVFQVSDSVSERAFASRIIKPQEWRWSSWLGVIEDELNHVVVNPEFEIEFWVLHDHEWKLKRKEVMKNKVNFPRNIILCDGERLFFQGNYRKINSMMERISYVYNIRTGVSRRSAFRWGAWFPCVSTLAEV